MNTLKNLKYKLAAMLLSDGDYLMLFREGKSGGGSISQDETHELNGVAKCLMENDDSIKNFILKTAEIYLKDHHPARQEFAKKVYDQDIF